MRQTEQDEYGYLEQPITVSESLQWIAEAGFRAVAAVLRRAGLSNLVTFSVANRWLFASRCWAFLAASLLEGERLSPPNPPAATGAAADRGRLRGGHRRRRGRDRRGQGEVLSEFPPLVAFLARLFAPGVAISRGKTRNSSAGSTSICPVSVRVALSRPAFQAR